MGERPAMRERLAKGNSKGENLREGNLREGKRKQKTTVLSLVDWKKHPEIKPTAGPT